MYKICIQLITYNSETYLPFLFESLHKQTFVNWQLLVLDNGSRDRTIELLQKELKSLSQSSELIISQENVGFAGGHNTLFKKTDSEYVLLLNPDMYLMPDCLEKLVNFLDTHPDTAAVSPRLMKWDFTKVSQGIESSFTDRIDSLGLKVYRSRRVVEWLAEKKWNVVKNEIMCHSERSQSVAKNPFIYGTSTDPTRSFVVPPQDDTARECEVFGVSGALPLYRRSALQCVADEQGAIFDPLFFMYKEDVDLAFRLREAGYKAYVKLDSVAYHDRTAAMPGRMDDVSAADNKKNQSELVKYLSYKNHLMTLYKNEYWQNFILDFPWIFWYEMKKFVWLVLCDRKVIRGLGEIRKNRDLLKKRRAFIHKNVKKVPWKTLRENMI
jgi:GT2 family glycosyltransferase